MHALILKNVIRGLCNWTIFNKCRHSDQDGAAIMKGEQNSCPVYTRHGSYILPIRQSSHLFITAALSVFLSVNAHETHLFHVQTDCFCLCVRAMCSLLSYS